MEPPIKWRATFLFVLFLFFDVRALAPAGSQSAIPIALRQDETLSCNTDTIIIL